MEAFSRDNECWDVPIVRTLNGLCHRSVWILQPPFDEALHDAFELLIIEPTLIIAIGDFAIQNLIDFEHFLR